MKIYYFTFLLAISLTQLSANENACSAYSSENYTISNQDENILEAVGHLERARHLSQSIADEEIRYAVSSHLKNCINCLKREQPSRGYDDIEETTLLLYENLGEILSDCQELQIRDEITSCVNDMMRAIEREN